MLTKTKIALSTLLVVGSASAALAHDVPENLIGDRYPFLEQTAPQTAAQAAFAYAAAQHSVKPFTAKEKALFDRADEAQPQ
jgi:5'-deoxynucleotidase YfbR-like HD superfamily hydrolase